MKAQITTIFTLLVCCFPAAAQEVNHYSKDSIHADPTVVAGQEFVSTGQPDQETLDMAAAAGIRAIIDFRMPGEDRGMDEEAETAARGMSYVSFPISGPADMTYEKAAELDRLLTGTEGPVLMHCISGNRVGALFALRASMKGASDAEALEIGERAGLTRSRSVIEDRLEEK